MSTQLVLQVFLARPWECLHGSTVAGLAGVSVGRTYPILARLERLGWLTSFWEDVDPRVTGRPPRRQYGLTFWGETRARNAVAGATAPDAPERCLSVTRLGRSAHVGVGGRKPDGLDLRFLERAARRLPGPSADRYRREFSAELRSLPDERRMWFALSILVGAGALRREVTGGDGFAADGTIGDRLTPPLHCRVHLWHAWSIVHQPGVAFRACRDCGRLARRTIFDPVIP